MRSIPFTVKFYEDDESGLVIAECISLPGVMSQGSTQREAEKNIKSAIEETLAAINPSFLKETEPRGTLTEVSVSLRV